MRILEQNEKNTIKYEPPRVKRKRKAALQVGEKIGFISIFMVSAELSV